MQNTWNYKDLVYLRVSSSQPLRISAITHFRAKSNYHVWMLKMCIFVFASGAVSFVVVRRTHVHWMSRSVWWDVQFGETERVVFPARYHSDKDVQNNLMVEYRDTLMLSPTQVTRLPLMSSIKPIAKTQALPSTNILPLCQVVCRFGTQLEYQPSRFSPHISTSDCKVHCKEMLVLLKYCTRCVSTVPAEVLYQLKY